MLCFKAFNFTHTAYYECLSKRAFKRQKIKAIILAGSRDFGRCPLTAKLPTALWPAAGKATIERLIAHLSKQGIEQAVICSNGDGALLKESIQVYNHLDVKYLTVTDVRKVITKRLSEYVPDATVTVMLLKLDSLKAHVIGKVHRPGQFAITMETTVMQILSMAGGLSDEDIANLAAYYASLK